MFNTYKYTILSLIRTPGVIIWLILFPLFMASIFSMMFSGIDEQSEVTKVNVVVVEPANTPEGNAFRGFIEAISQSGEDANDDKAANSEKAVSSDEAASNGILNTTFVDNAEEAKCLVLANDDAKEDDEDNSYSGYVELNEDGIPSVHLVPPTSYSGIGSVQNSILVLLMDNYTANAALVKDLFSKDPAALMKNPAIFEKLLEPVSATKQVQLTHFKPKESVRYYFALLGMSGMFGASAALFAINRMRANSSALGARRNVSATSHTTMITATFLASWTICFACLLLAFAYMKFVIGVDFGDRDAMCIGAIALSSLCAVSLGCAVSTIPKIPANAKDGIISAIVCLGALFAGLYGTFAMDLANIISANFPIGEIINPVADVAQTFYTILYFDSLQPFFKQIAILACMSVVFFAISVNSFRRTRYASL